MSASTSKEAIRAVKVGIILFVLFVVTRYAVLPAFGPSFGGLADFIQLVTIALVAAILVEMVENMLT